MTTNIGLSQEESLVLYEKARAKALENNRFVVGRHQIDLPEELKASAVQSWLSHGWLTTARTFNGSAAYQVPEKYRSYMPGDPRCMTAEESAALMELVRLGVKPDGTVRVSGIPSQGLWRLIDAQVIRTNRTGSCHKYVLDPTYR